MFSIFRIIIVVFLHLTSARNDSLSKNYQFSNQNLAVSDISFNNKTLFYALYTQSSKQCTIIQEIHPFTNYSVTKKCNFLLKVDKIQLIVGFGTDKAILIAQEATTKSLKLKAITVHIADCKIKEADLVDVPLDWSNRKFYRDYIDVVVSEQGFEVIIKGLSHPCTKPDAKVYCGLSLDADGNKIEGPLIWPKMAYEEIDIVSPVMADATGQGYYFVNRDTSLLAFQLNRKGGPKYVKLWYTPMPHSNIWREGYSTANHVDGMCYNFNSTIGCWQTDQEGELKILVEFEFDHKFKASIKQCNITQSSKIEDSTKQTIVIPDTTIQTTTTTPASTIQLTSTQEITVQETTTQEITIPESTTQEIIIPETTTQESTTPKTITQENLTSDTTTEKTITKETIREETTEDAIMEPNTVKGITVKDITTQEATTQSNTTENDTTIDGTISKSTVQGNSTTQDNITESNAVQETNATQESVTESDALQNNVSDDTPTAVQVSTENVILENTTENNAVLENTTGYDTLDVITVQGLTTQAVTTQIIEAQENVTTESAVKETTGQDETMNEITVQEITTVQDNTTQKNVVRRSLSEIKSSDEQKVWNLYIHNLRNGGFVVLVITCPNRICNGNDEHYYLMKINAQGKLIGQLEVNINSKCYAVNNEILAKVFENDQGQYCSVRLCKSKKLKEESLEILVNCYCNSDFK